MLTRNEIHDEFIDFFRSKGHRHIPSSGLVPRNDPTLLFTNAGMVQFKDFFLDKAVPDYKTAVTCQKCLRAGGKQSDISNVGYTARHHTFFEMLGNFSFGDYFKEKAIIYAWELFIDRFKIPADRLWATVYTDDDEAMGLWVENTGIPKERVIRLGAKDNFWQMGDTGPCGPCSEIIIDQGADVGCGRPECAVGCDCDRFLELWNLVFMQYERHADGSLIPLPKPNIDTGMGLERITAVLQGKRSNFDTDIFIPIIGYIAGEAGLDYGRDGSIDSSIRIIADHIRSITFLLDEGVIPTNEGRGYVLRKIIRRAQAHARLAGIDRPFLFSVMDFFIDSYAKNYQGIERNQKSGREILRLEEQGFLLTLDKALNKYDELKSRSSRELTGADAFLLSDTFGMPREIIEDITRRDGITVDWQEYEGQLNSQKTRSRGAGVSLRGISSKEQPVSGHPDAADSDNIDRKIYEEIIEHFGPTKFSGYEETTSSAVIICLLKDGHIVDSINESERGIVILDRTPFYGESGGQAGDIGEIVTDACLVHIIDTKKSVSGLFIHIVEVTKGSIKQSMPVTCEVSKDARDGARRNHTATHLLHAALRNRLGGHVKQAGSYVGKDRFRFDYTHMQQVSREERTAIARVVNSKIIENIQLQTHIMGVDEAIRGGATALFDEKYGDTVRVVDIPGFSKELCGGTHCSSTGEIGYFVITSESSIASGVRRIEGVTGYGAIDYIEERLSELQNVSEILKTDRPIEKIEGLNKRVRALEKELDRTKVQGASGDISDIINSAVSIDGAKALVSRRDGLDKGQLRDYADRLRDSLKSGVIFVISVVEGQAVFVCMVTTDLVKRYNAGNIMKHVCDKTDGRGGGKPDMAQGGTKALDRLPSIQGYVTEAMSR